MWRKDGKELFYLTLDSRLMAVDVDPVSRRTGVPRTLFQTGVNIAGLNIGVNLYDVANDGKRFLIAEDVRQARPPAEQFHLVLNWTAGLKP
jgi:hypothetical protein